MNAAARRIGALALLAVLACACTPAAPPLVLEDLLATNVAGTLSALPTITLAPSASPSPRPTRLPPTAIITPSSIPSLTPIPSFTPSPTWTPSPTPIPPGGREVGQTQGSGNYFCRLLDQTPGDWETYTPGQIVYAYWIVQNLSKKDWPKGGIDIVYLSGYKLHVGKSELKSGAAVPVGLTMNVIIPLRAPKDPGEYQTTWVLKRGNQKFCEFVFGMVVRDPTETPTPTPSPSATPTFGAGN